MSSILRGNDSFDTGDYKEHINVPTNYHIYNGEVTATNTVVTNCFATKLYTGNGSTQSINTDVDMSTQWGNDASETFGGLNWIKGRSGATSNYLMDTVRGATKNIYSNSITAETTEATGLTAFTGTGFNIGALAGMNTSAATYASWNFQTTHRKTGTTNHGKAYTEHYNPFTGFTMIKYEGSGIAGHEIPHMLGRKLDFRVVKNLSSTVDWLYSGIGAEIGYYMYLNSTIASSTTAVLSESNNSSIIYSGTIGSGTNTSTNTYILYGWANSYYDEANTLIGNYEIGVYQGTGAAGNKVTTRGKPAWVMVKRLDSTGFWWICDNQRGNGTLSLYANASNAEANDTNDCTFESNSFTLTGVGNDSNASGGQYLYMVVYDNDSGSGKSKYPKATDTTNLNINALVPYANGIDAKGSKVSISYKNETITGLTYTQGKNYVYAKNDGTYGVSKYAPQYNTYNGFGDYYDVNSNKWYSGVSVYSNDGTNTSGLTGINGATISNVSGLIKLAGSTTDSAGMVVTFPTNINKLYNIAFSYNSGGDNPYISIGNKDMPLSTTGIKTYDFTASSTSSSFTLWNATGTDNINMYFDNISVYPIKADGTPDLTNAIEITESRNYLNHIVHADNDGGVLYVEELPKIEYKDIVKANEFKGKNACTAWAYIDGISTAPLIVDGYNISSVIRVAAGTYRIYFSTPMDDIKFSLEATTINTVVKTAVCFETNDYVRTTGYITVACRVSLGSGYDTLENSNFSIAIFGGKN